MPKETKKATKKTAKEITAAVWVLDNENMVHALSYFPFFIGPIAMYFLGNTNNVLKMHHIKYATIMAIAVLLSFLILNNIFSQLVSMVYIVASGYFAFKAYKWEVVKVEILDTIEQKFNEQIKK